MSFVNFLPTLRRELPSRSHFVTTPTLAEIWRSRWAPMNQGNPSAEQLQAHIQKYFAADSINLDRYERHDSPGPTRMKGNIVQMRATHNMKGYVLVNLHGFDIPYASLMDGLKHQYLLTVPHPLEIDHLFVNNPQRIAGFSWSVK